MLSIRSASSFVKSTSSDILRQVLAQPPLSRKQVVVKRNVICILQFGLNELAITIPENSMLAPNAPDTFMVIFERPDGYKNYGVYEITVNRFFGGPANSFNNYSGMQTTHATRLLQRGVSDPHKCYVSKDIDASLPSLLTEAMKLLEARFMNLDQGKRSLQALGFTPF